MTLVLLSWLGIGCWCACFWWMHRISSRQDAMLKELHEMTKRIEKLSKSEHDLISDVHPQVSEIKETSRTFGMPFRPKRAYAGDSGLAELRTSG